MIKRQLRIDGIAGLVKENLLLIRRSPNHRLSRSSLLAFPALSKTLRGLLLCSHWYLPVVEGAMRLMILSFLLCASAPAFCQTAPANPDNLWLGASRRLRLPGISASFEHWPLSTRHSNGAKMRTPICKCCQLRLTHLSPTTCRSRWPLQTRTHPETESFAI